MKTLSKFLLATLLLIASPLNATTINGPAASSDSFQFGRGANAVNKDLIFNNGASNKPRFRYNMTTSKLQFSHDGVVFSDVGSGGGAVGADYGQLESNLLAAEQGQNSSIVPNQFLDTFLTGLGTQSNVAPSNSSLQISVGQTSGTYERLKSTSALMSHVNGKAIARIQQVAPQNTACSPTCSSSAVTFSFFGDVTGILPASKNVIISKLSTDDGANDQIFVMNSSDEVAQLSTTSVTYNSGTNLTAVVIANPGLLDLSLGLSSTVFNTSLRIEPFDHQFQVKTKAAGSLETMVLKDAHSRGTIGITGQASISLSAMISGIAGTIIHSDIYKSQNGTYCVVRLLEQTNTNPIWHFGHSENSCATFTAFATTKSVGNASINNEFNGYTFTGFSSTGDFQYAKRNQVVVANNGKAFIGYYRAAASNRPTVAAVYADLSVGSPAISDTPSTGTDTGNDAEGATAGVVFSQGSFNVGGFVVSCDPIDLSLCAVSFSNSNNDNMRIRTYTSGGSALGVLSPAAPTGGAAYSRTDYTGTIEVSGSGVAHFVQAFAINSPDFSTFTWSQASNTWGSSTAFEIGTSSQIIDSYVVPGTSKHYLLYEADTNNKICYKSATLGASPTYSARKCLNPWNGADTFNGYHTGSAALATATSVSNLNKSAGQRIVADPSNSNHVFFIYDAFDPDLISRSRMAEIADDTAFVGQYTASAAAAYTNNETTLRDSSSTQKLAQQFTASSTRVRSVAFLMRQTGTIASGSTCSANIQPVVGGVPNGTITATAVNTYDPSKISTTGGTPAAQPMYFNFSNLTLTGVYAVVVDCNFTVSGTNYLIPQFAAGGVTGNVGVLQAYNGTSWSTLFSGSHSLRFEVNSEYIYDVSNAYAANASPIKAPLQDGESSIGLVDSTNIQIISRRSSTEYSAGHYLTGIPFRRVAPINAGGAISSITAPVVLGYDAAKFDPNLVFQVSLGDSSTGQINQVTGVSNGVQVHETSGNHAGADKDITAVSTDFVTDANFQSGRCYSNLAGLNHHLLYNAYNNGPSQKDVNLPYLNKFIIEAEISGLAGSGTQRTVISRGDTNTTARLGWQFGINSSNFLWFRSGAMGASLVATTASDKVEPSTYHKIRVTSDGSNIHLWRSEGAALTSGTNGASVFTEVASYSSQNVATVDNNIDQDMYVGSEEAGNYFNGKLGYIRVAAGVQTFVNGGQGYYNQQPLMNCQNLGTKSFCLSRSGSTSFTTLATTNFDSTGLINASANATALVDSYDQDFFFSHDIGASNQGYQMDLKLTMGRAGASVQPAWMGLIYRFSK